MAAFGYVEVDQLGEKHQLLFCTDDEQTEGENFSTAQKITQLYQLQNGGVILEENAEKNLSTSAYLINRMQDKIVTQR